LRACRRAGHSRSESLDAVLPVGTTEIKPRALSAEEEIFHTNLRGFQLPITINPEVKSRVREVDLYLSRDQGKTWERYARATPEKKAFDFLAGSDGLYYFSIAVIDRDGRQDPADLSRTKVGQKILIDTVKPVVKITSARWVGDEIEVCWKVREKKPDWSTLKLEYRIGKGNWTALHFEPSGQSSKRIRPDRSGNVGIRMELSDLAGNKGAAKRRVPAAHSDDR
jgi:hypothetical protein